MTSGYLAAAALPVIRNIREETRKYLNIIADKHCNIPTKQTNKRLFLDYKREKEKERTDSRLVTVGCIPDPISETIMNGSYNLSSLKQHMITKK